MRSGPERTRRIQEVTVVLDADADLAGPPERERDSHRHSHPGPGAAASGDASRIVRHLPQPSLPATQRPVDQDPVLVAYRLPDLGSQSGRGGGLLGPPA